MYVHAHHLIDPSPSHLPHQLHHSSMEDVWKDISLASLYDHPTTTHGGPAAFRGMNCQDFLSATTCNKLLVDPPERPPPPPKILSLSSGTLSDFQGLQTTTTTSGAVMKPKTQLEQTSDDGVSCRPSFVSFSRSSEALDSSSVFIPCFNKRDLPPQNDDADDNCSSRRHKRMMKNRESASRSRARKQELIDLSIYLIDAYTNELELELAHLREENARLKRQLAKFYLEGASAQLSQRHTLYRTSTAPF